jgi:bacillolysin
MKKLLIMLMLAPLASFGQLIKISLNCEGLGIINQGDYSATINELLQTNSLVFVPINADGEVQQEENGLSHIALQQMKDGVPVEHAVIKLHYRDEGLYYINGEYATAFADMTGIIPEQEALNMAKNYIGASMFIWDNLEELNALAGLPGTSQIYPTPSAVLVYYRNPYNQEGGEDQGSFKRAYKFDILALEPYSRFNIYIDAATGIELGRRSLLWESNADTRYSGSRNICTSHMGGSYVLREGSGACTLGPGGVETYNMHGGGNFGAATDFTDADDNWTAGEFHNAAKDDAGLEAHWAAEKSMAYFNFILGRNSYDNAGGTVRGYVNADLNVLYSVGNDNAFWDGSRMIFGKGTGNPVVTLDIVGHELGHAICQYDVGGLVQEGEPGAIAEGLSDIWGSIIEGLYAPTKSKWLIGEDVFSGGLRNMKDPPAKGDPKAYGGTNWVTTTGCVPTPSNDYCGIHTNCTVLDYWFYLMVESPFPGIGAVGLSKAQSIVYRAENLYLTPYTDYAALRSYTIQAARDLYGDCSDEVKRTINAWANVGVGTGTPSVPSSLYLSTTISTTTNYVAGSITAVNQIVPPASVVYEAFDRVELNPGFVANSNTFFMARIVACRDVFVRAEVPLDNLDDELHGNGAQQFAFETDKLVPNPAKNNVTLLSGNDLSAAEIEVYDISGKKQEAHIQKSGQYKAIISWDKLKSGLYLLKVTTDNHSKVFKLVIAE